MRRGSDPCSTSRPGETGSRPRTSACQILHLDERPAFDTRSRPTPTPATIELPRERCAGTDRLPIGPAENGASTHLALPHGRTFVEALTSLGRAQGRVVILGVSGDTPVLV
jgi:hypothetical protein